MESTLTLDGSVLELGRLAAGVADFCAANGLADETELQLNLVLEELFVNAVRHGGCEGREGAAWIWLGYRGGAVEVDFRDRGAPFDPTTAPAADVRKPLEAGQGSGLGIHLVRQIMREVAYRREGGWNILTMRHRAAESQETK